MEATSVWLRVDLAAPRFAIERSELCGPVPLDGGRVATVTVATSGPVPPRARSPILRLTIGADGNVLDAKLTVGTGVPALDQEILRTAPQSRFAPALLDGRPVAVWWERGRATLVP